MESTKDVTVHRVAGFSGFCAKQRIFLYYGIYYFHESRKAF